jgi:hypothetical protein
MNRYEYNKKTKTQAYQTTRLPVIPRSYSDKYIFTREGDRLDTLAYELYDDPRYWVLLANANNLGKGSLMVPPGIQLRLPSSITFNEFKLLLRQAEENR